MGDLRFTPVEGLLLARVSPGTSLQYGDRIRLEGRLETPPENEDFSYRNYLANQNIYSYMSYPTVDLLQHGQGNLILSALYSFRQRALDIVYRLYPDPEASLLAGILLGDQSGITAQVQEAFRLTGTSHIIVISGFNITIIAALFTFLFTRLLGTRRGAIVSAVGIILYTLMVGANPAVLRAAILGMLTLLGLQVGRKQVGLNSLVFAAALMALLTPTVLWDVSFQLSFAATLGIMLYADLFTGGFTNLAARFIPRQKAENLAAPVGEYFLITMAALLTTLPLMVYYFKRISLTSLIANPLILPAQPPLMVLGGLSVLIGMLFQPLGQLLGLDYLAIRGIHHPGRGVAGCHPRRFHTFGADYLPPDPHFLCCPLCDHFRPLTRTRSGSPSIASHSSHYPGCSHRHDLESCFFCS